MRLVFGLVLIVGVGLAGFAVMMAKERFDQYQSAIAQQKAQLDQVVEVTEVLVTSRQIRYGEKVQPQDVVAVRWPANAVPEGTYQTLDDFLPEGDKVLRTAIRIMEKGEPLLKVKVSKPGEDAGVSSRLAKGMRAFAISVDVASGVSGFLSPGDRVDVYWSGEVANREVTKLIQANMNLLAVDQTSDLDRNSPTIARTITVEATPQEVAALAQAQQTGRLSLALVGASDETVVESVEMDQNELLGIEVQQVEEAEVAQVCTIRTRRGAEVVVIPIPCTN
jgi:pilus assembly protein CpaB